MPTTSGEWALSGARSGLGSRAISVSGLWRHLPAWMFLVYGCLLLNCELTNLSPERLDLAPTVVFPLIPFATYYAARALWAPDVTRRRGLLLATLALALGLPTLNLAYHRPFPLSETSLRWIYELSNFAWAGLLAFHAWRKERSLFLACFGAGMLYGVLLENGGILLGFFQETRLVSHLPPFVAPVATMIGWSMVLYMSFFVVQGLRGVLPWLRRSALASGAAVALAAVLFDLQLDPLATALHCWVWAPSFPAFFHGVPLVNFVAWLCALFPFAYVVFRYRERLGLPDGAPWEPRQLRVLVAAVPAALVVATALFLAGMVACEGARGPTYELLNGDFARVLALL